MTRLALFNVSEDAFGWVDVDELLLMSSRVIVPARGLPRSPCSGPPCWHGEAAVCSITSGRFPNGAAWRRKMPAESRRILLFAERIAAATRSPRAVATS